MQELLNKVKINDSTFRSYIVRIVARNISAIAEPCHFPVVKKHYYEMLRMTGLTESDVRAFTKRRWKGRKEAAFLIHREPIANFYIFLMQYFLKKRNNIVYKYLMSFYMIRYYANLMRGSFPKYCNPDVFKYALENIAKTHLFVREKTIANALQHISRDMMRLWTKGLLENNLDDISRFMQDSRTRISQSRKSFAEAYYRAEEQGTGFRSDTESDNPEDTYKQLTTTKTNKLAEELTKKIVVYRLVDRKAQIEARKLTKIKTSIATQLTTKLNNIKFSDNILIIYKLFLRDIKSVKEICGKDYYTYVRKKMSIRRTTDKIYLKQQINILILKLIKEFNYKKQYDKLTNQTQYLINLFLAFYITMILKNTICSK